MLNFFFNMSATSESWGTASHFPWEFFMYSFMSSEVRSDDTKTISRSPNSFAYASQTSFKIGVNARQGGHQVPQMSTIATRPARASTLKRLLVLRAARSKSKGKRKSKKGKKAKFDPSEFQIPTKEELKARKKAAQKKQQGKSPAQPSPQQPQQKPKKKPNFSLPPPARDSEMYQKFWDDFKPAGHKSITKEDSIYQDEPIEQNVIQKRKSKKLQ